MPRIRLLLTREQARLAGLEEHWLEVQARKDARDRSAAQDVAELRQIACTLDAEARQLGISTNAMLKWSGISWGTWRRIQDGTRKPKIWLPRLRAAQKQFAVQAEAWRRIQEAADEQARSHLHFDPGREAVAVQPDQGSHS